MSEKEIIKGTLTNGNVTLSFVEVCHYCELPEDVLEDWIAHGLLGDDIRSSIEATQFNREMIERIRSANRLHRELEVNVQGVILVLELLDQMTELRNELAILKRL